MRSFKSLPVLALFAIGALQSCSSSTSTSPSSSSNQVTFTSGSTATYTEQRRDTANSKYGQDQIDPSSTDTVHTTVVETNIPYQNKTNVKEIVNVHSRTGLSDTDYVWQDPNNGDFYRYNYGVEVLNNQAAVVQFLGHKIDVGWVLQTKMSGNAGTSWEAARNTVDVTVPGIPQPVPVSIVDTATEQSDTTVIVGTKSMTARHSVHVVRATAPLGALDATILIDTYITPDYGLVLNVIHSTKLTGLANAQVSGQSTTMVSHP